jgi:hypothetical protein
MQLPCCCEKKVLIWLNNSHINTSADYIDDVRTVFEDMGLTVDTEGGTDGTPYSGNIHDYKLILWPFVEDEPSWWSEIEDNNWSGRLHYTTEHDTIAGGSGGSNEFANSLSGTTGLSVIDDNDSLDPVCSQPGTVETDDLTSGLSVFLYAATSRVSGGTGLSKTLTGDHVWIARNKPGGSAADFVLAGDMNHLVDTCTVMGSNAPFFENMWNVSI